MNLGNGEFAIAYTKGNEDFLLDEGNHNVYFRHLDVKSAEGEEDINVSNASIQDFDQIVKLTNSEVTEANNATARIAKFGDNFIIGWHQHKKDDAFIGEYDINGQPVVEYKPIKGLLLNPMFGMITLPNGNVFWASSTPEGDGTLHLNWIKKNTP